MKSFKELVEDDIRQTFLDIEAFAEEHEIGGETVPCVLDKVLTQGDSDKAHIGVFVNQLTIYVEADRIEAPVEGEVLYVDGSAHLVRSVSLEGGMLVIVAEANSQ